MRRSNQNNVNAHKIEKIMPEYIRDQELIKELITSKEDSTAKNFTFQRVISNFFNGSVYYIDYDSDELDESDAFNYAFVPKDGKTAELYNDGIQAIERLQFIMTKRMSLGARISEFALSDLMRSLLIILIFGLILLSAFTKEINDAQLFSLASTVIGFYFGRETVSERR